MRTTLDIDEDVLRAVQERARRERSSAGRVLSTLVREALTTTPGSDEAIEYSPVTGLPLLPRHGGIVTSEMVYRLMDEEE